jgi:uncharacterized protein HemX
MKILLIIPWLAAGVAAWYFMETNGSKLKKADATLYESLKDDKDGKKKEEAKKKIPTLQQEIKAEETKITEADEKIKKNANDSTAKDEKKAAEEELAKKKDELSVLENLDKSWHLPTLSFSNIAWTLGIFIVVGGVGHVLTKWVIKMVSGDEDK